MGAKLNLTNKRFTKLIALHEVQRREDNGAIKWVFQCDCGKKCVSNGSQVYCGVVRSCGCLRKTKDAQESGLKVFYFDYRYGAKVRGHGFKLSFKIFKNITRKNCYYCTLPPQNRYRKFAFKASGIDRINNNKGYYIDNVVPCCTFCNRAKCKLSQNDFISWINRIKQSVK